MYYYYNPNELYHHGIKGQKWGVRRFQNADGSLKAAGKKRYGDDSGTPSSKPTRGERFKGALKKVGKAVGKAAAVASGVSGEVSTKYGTFKIGGASDETTNAGEQAVSRLVNRGFMDVKVTNVYVDGSKRETPEDRAARVRKEKYDALPDEVKKDRSIGKPSGEPVDKSSKEYQDLFKDDSPFNSMTNGGTRNPKQRELIKNMADAGYDVDQIRKKLKKIDDDWDSPYNEQKYKSDQYWDKVEEDRKSFWDDED